MKKKLIIFDLDGTILDTKYDLYESLMVIYKKYNLEKIKIEELVSNLGRGLTVLFNNLVGDKLEEDKKAEAFKEYIDYYREHCTDFTIPYNEIVKVINVLKEKGYLLAVVSNKNDGMVKKIINHYYPNIFDFYTGLKEGYRRKPDIDLINLALNTLNIDAKDALYIGDSKYDILTARNAKMDSIIVSYGYGDLKVLKEYSPDIIASKPIDILLYL